MTDKETLTWADRVANLRKALGRDPNADEMLTAAQVHIMTPDEVEAQRQSFAQASIPTGDPRFD